MLSKHGELNQTKLLSYCGLNLAKHKNILDELERKKMIEKNIIPWGNKSISNYKITTKGLDFCKMILEPYENMFPRLGEEESDQLKTPSKEEDIP